MLSIFLIGLALSMDALSLALGLGTTGINHKNKILLSSLVALMHYLMPNLGLFLGNRLFTIVEINLDLFMVIVFLYLGIRMFIKRNEKTKIVVPSIFNYGVIAFSVSIDSFSVGLGLESIAHHHLAPLVFAFCSGMITYLGLVLGEYSVKLLEEKAILLGSIILILLAIVNLIEHFLPFI